MKKKLDDYIHLYIGQQVITKDGLIFELKGVCESEIETGQLLAIVGHPGNNNEGGFDEYWLHDIKLLLRPISDIRVYEADEIINILSGRQYIEPKLLSIKFRETNEKGLSFFSIQYNNFQKIKHIDDKPIPHLLHITNWGTINLYTGSSLSNNAFQIYVTKYLLSKGFDIFGLIDSGLAKEKQLYENTKNT